MIEIPPPPAPTRKGLLGEVLSDDVQLDEKERKSELDSPRNMQAHERTERADFKEQLDLVTFPPIPSTFCLSFEFFPPHTEQGLEKLKVTSRLLGAFYPSYYSVTFGAAGNTQNFTVSTVLTLKESSITPIAPHISCIATTPDSIRKMLQTYKAAGINHLVVLRGDIPSGMMKHGYFSYAANLIEFIRKEYGNQFYIEAAAHPESHPESLNPDKDLKNFANKVRKGVDRAITQYFYNKDSYFYYIERCQQEGITIPIIPGIMPITNYHQLRRFSDSCGAEIPRWLRLRLESYADDPVSLQKLGQEFVTRMCQDLLDEGVPGLHFYTLNKAEPSIKICQDLRWK